MREQIAKEAQAQQELRRERDQARDEAAALKLSSNSRALEAQQAAELSLRLKAVTAERETLAGECKAAQGTISELKARMCELENMRQTAETAPPEPNADAGARPSLADARTGSITARTVTKPAKRPPEQSSARLGLGFALIMVLGGVLVPILILMALGRL